MTDGMRVVDESCVEFGWRISSSGADYVGVQIRVVIVGKVGR